MLSSVTKPQNKNPIKRYQAPTAMETLAAETGIEGDVLLKDKRGRFERFQLSRKIARKLGVRRKDISVPKSGPIGLQGKALGKVASSSVEQLMQVAGEASGASFIGAHPGLFNSPLLVEAALNGDNQELLRLGQLNPEEGETPTQEWARTSDLS